MKFRNPKTGKVFENIKTAIWNDCRRRVACDADCALFDIRKSSACYDYVISHPDEAARRMGMEVVEDHTGDTTEMIKEEPMEKKGKPRICQVLGGEDNPLEVDEVWCVTGNDRAQYRITYDGNLEYRMPNYNGTGYGRWISTDIPTDFIARPDRIVRKPRFTEDEVADAKALMRILGATGIERTAQGGIMCAVVGAIAKVVIEQELFPSLRPGQAVKLEEIIGQ